MKFTKRITALFLTMVLLLSGVVGVAAAEAAYTLSDVTNVLKYTAGWGDEYYKLSYDYNCDGTVNIHDATCILKMLAGWNEDNIYLKKPTDEYIKNLEAQLTDYHTKKAGDNSYGITYDVHIVRYYGTYNGADVVFYYCDGMDHIQWIWTDIVAGYEFTYSDGNSIKVWKDGEHYSLRQAYESGILTKANIKRIADGGISVK